MWLGEAEVATERTDFAHAHIGHVRCHLGQGGEMGSDHGRTFEPPMRRNRPDVQGSIRKRHASEIRNQLDIDQALITQEPLFHRQQQLGAPSIEACGLSILGKQS